MKHNDISIAIILALVSAFSLPSNSLGQSITAALPDGLDGHQDPQGGANYYCIGETVTLTAEGNGAEPTEKCEWCTPWRQMVGDWELQSTTYQWSPSSLGTGKTATLNIASPTPSASCTITYHYACKGTVNLGVGTTPVQTWTNGAKSVAGGSATWSAVAKPNDSDACDPVAEKGAEVQLNDMEIDESWSQMVPDGHPGGDFGRLKGKLKGVKGTKTYEKTGGRQVGPGCGLEWKVAKQGGQPGWSFGGATIGTVLPFPFSAYLNFNYSSPIEISQLYNADAKPFVQYYGQQFIIGYKDVHGTWDAGSYYYDQDTPQQSIEGESATVDASEATSENAEIGFTCKKPCCPTQTQNQ